MDRNNASSQATPTSPRTRRPERLVVRLHLRDATALLLVLLTWAMLIAAVVR